jgi:uncharacterized protein YjiS (DUF1127 family)
MTMLSHIRPMSPVTTRDRSGLRHFLLAHCKRSVDRMVAAMIARHQRQAEIFVLRRLSDRELQDIGIYRDQIGPGLEDAARTRAHLLGWGRTPRASGATTSKIDNRR